MTIFDYIVLGILFVSIILSIMRGLVREVLSLSGWVVALIVVSSYATEFEPLLPSEINGVSFRIMTAFIVVFLSVLLITMLISMLLSALVKGTGLGFIDRFLGSIFGFLRGMLVVMLLVLIAGLTTLPQQSFWQQALLSGPLEVLVIEVRPWLPNDLSSRISYGSDETY